MPRWDSRAAVFGFALACLVVAKAIAIKRCAPMYRLLLIELPVIQGSEAKATSRHRIVNRGLTTVRRGLAGGALGWASCLAAACSGAGCAARCWAWRVSGIGASVTAALVAICAGAVTTVTVAIGVAACAFAWGRTCGAPVKRLLAATCWSLGPCAWFQPDNHFGL